MRLGCCSIALAMLIQQGLDYIILKTDIHSFVSNTETFLSDIWKPRYRFTKHKTKTGNVTFGVSVWEAINPTNIYLIPFL